MKSIGSVIVAIVVVAAIIGGIIWWTTSDNDDEEATNNTNTIEQTQQGTAEQSQTIVGLATATEDLTTLAAALQSADLVETLNSEGPFTVFAPTNEAFAALPEGTLDDLLLPENKQQLRSVLTYHVVEGNVASSDLSDGQVITTVNGGNLTVSVSGDTVKINDATVIQPDVEASNGVVHIINAVLQP